METFVDYVKEERLSDYEEGVGGAKDTSMEGLLPFVKTELPADAAAGIHIGEGIIKNIKEEAQDEKYFMAAEKVWRNCYPTEMSSSPANSSHLNSASGDFERGGTWCPRFAPHTPSLRTCYTKYRKLHYATYILSFCRDDASSTALLHCDYCIFTCANRSRMDRHFRNKHNGYVRQCKHKCHLCPYSTNSKPLWKLHLSGVHLDQRPFVCSECKKAFKKNATLKMHIRRVHGDGRKNPYPCNKCNARFVDANRLSVHKATIHCSESLLHCRVCRKQFRSNLSYYSHMRSVHSDILERKCRLCLEKFTTHTELNEHLSQHLNADGKFVCLRCTDVLSDWAHLREHAKIHTSEEAGQHVCTYCNTRFFLLAALKRHKCCTGRKRHKCSADATKEFRCEHCSVVFKTAKTLHAHNVRRHTDRSFPCPDCDASFARADERNRHQIVRHSRNFQHRCKRCGRGFVTAWEMRRHSCSAVVAEGIDIDSGP